MNLTVLDKKLKKRLAFLENHRFSFITPLVFSGTIKADNETEETTLHFKEGVVWEGARRSFDVSTTAVFPERSGKPGVLVLNLGTTHVSDSLSFLYGPEAVVFVDGVPFSGTDPNHSVVRIPVEYMDGRVHDLRLDGWTGLSGEPYLVGFIGLAETDENVCALYDAASVCFDTAAAVSDPTLRDRLLNILDRSLDCLDMSGDKSTIFADEIIAALDSLKRELSSLPANPLCSITACGHGHIDLAWLWRTCTTRKKGARTFLNVLRLMEQYDPFYYSQTQAQLYKWIEEDYPEIFEQVCARIAEGRWELLGGMWVEPDCNITGAESLVRQFLLYHLFTEEKFGTSGTPVVWLPDTFGFCGQLPQLMKSAGIKAFGTAKLTWNQYNKMPSESFIWRGIDGSEILSHIVSVSKPDWFGGTYSADLTPEELLTTVDNAQNRIASRNMLFAYGMGDGGGGPTDMMLRRASQIAPAYPGLPSLNLGTFKDFYEKLSDEKKLPVWDGELYLELHRGTYTSQSETKRRNRECEAALNCAEFLSTWASLSSASSYPAKTLRDCWQKLCLNQFHDILPGSSVHEVYEDAARDHETIKDICDSLCCDAVNRLGARIAKDASVVLVNNSPFSADGLVELPAGIGGAESVYTSEGTAAKQITLEGRSYLAVRNIPAYGYRAYSSNGHSSGTASAPTYSMQPASAPFTLQNNRISVDFDGNGDISGWNDLDNGRQIVREDKRMAQWQMFDDNPGDWDAWDIDEDYGAHGFEKAELISVSRLDCDLFTRVCMEKHIGRSKILETVTLFSDSGKLDFHCSIDYQETHKLLRLSSDVNIHSPYAEYATQFGSIMRPTTRNTSWEQAKFECCMQGWVDLCEGDYGVGLACDNRYGVSVCGGTISLAVQRSATFPDESADKGMHEINFSIVPHLLQDKNDLIRAAYNIKRPVQIYSLRNPGGCCWSESFAESSKPGLIIETIKKAEQGEGIVVRLYESGNTRGSGTLKLSVPISKSFETGILEDNGVMTDCLGRELCFSYRPFEIKTFRIIPEEQADERYCNE